MRPRYCTAEDRRKESLVFDRFLQVVAKQFPGVKWTIQLEPTDADGDGVLIKGEKPAYLVEIKNRTGSGERFETWQIAKDKIERCMANAASRNMEFLLLMVWDGDIFAVNGKALKDLEVRTGGRWDRNDPHDVEPMLHIPRKLFTRFA